MKSIIFLLALFINTSLVLSKHKKHDLGLRGNTNKVESDSKKCVLLPEYCEGNITLVEKIHCSLNNFIQNNTNVSGTILFYSSGANSEFTILEGNSTSCDLLNNDLNLIHVVEGTFNSTIIDMIGNGSLIESNLQQNGTIENIGISSFLEEIDLIDIEKLSKLYSVDNGIGLIDSNNTDSFDIENGAFDSISNGKLINETTSDYNSTIGTFEEIVSRFPDLRELYEISRGQKRSVGIRDLLTVSSRLIRSLQDYDSFGKEYGEDIDKLKERLSESEIEGLKEQSQVNGTLVAKEPWYLPLKKFGVGILTGQNSIFSAIISIVESVVGISPIGSIVNVIVRVIAAIVTIIYEIIQKRKNNANLVRVLKSLDHFDVSESSKTMMANRLIDRIMLNADFIQKSQSLLRSLYMDLSELAHQAQKNLHNVEEQIDKEGINKLLNGTLNSMLSNATRLENTSIDGFDRNSLLIRSLGFKIMESGGLSLDYSLRRSTFEKLGENIELFLDESYNSSWDGFDLMRSLNLNETIFTNSSIVGSMVVTTTSTSLTNQTVKAKWYDGLIQFSKKVSEMSGITSMLDMLLELFGAIFANSPKAESILSILRLVVYLIKSIFNIFGNIASSRKLISMTRIIPNEIANNRELLQLTLKKLNDNSLAIENERKIIDSNVEEIASLMSSSEISEFVNIDKEFEEYLTYNASESEIGNYTLSRVNMLIESKLGAVEYYLDDKRLLSAVESSSMSTEINFKSLFEHLGSLFENSYSKIKQVLMTVFSTIFKGSKIVSFIEKLLDLIMAVLKSIYHIFKGKNAQRLLIQSLEECEMIEFQNTLLIQLERALKNNDLPMTRLLD